METGTISLDLPVQLQDRMAGAHVQVLLQPLVGADREKLLRSISLAVSKCGISSFEIER